MHMLEVEIPFLHFLRGRPDPPDWGIVPMIVGDLDEAGIDHLAEILAARADPETLFVFSVDLSHYHGYERARRLDRYSIDAIMGLDREALDRAETDANQVLMAMVTLARRLGWEPTLGMERNSGDVIADKSRVVGYVAVAFHRPLVLDDDQKAELLGWARRAVERCARGEATLEPARAWLEEHPLFAVRRGVFVTLKKQGRLRGCIGRIEPGAPLHLAIRDCAVGSASRDERFDPVTPDELGELRVSISILGYPTRIRVERPEQYLEVLEPEIDGVVILHQGRRSVFLPEVWKQIPDPTEFLTRLCRKQGAPDDAWRAPSIRLYRFSAQVFAESP
jgi:AmmeMemoRadiSam system protein A